MHILINLLHQPHNYPYLLLSKETNFFLNVVEHHKKSREGLVISNPFADTFDEYFEMLLEVLWGHEIVCSGEESVDVFGEFRVFLECTVDVELSGV